MFERIVYAFVIVAFVEEGFRYLFLYRFGYKSKEFDSSSDIIVYSTSTFISLGFALYENLFVVSFVVGLFRTIAFIPLHVSCGILIESMLSVAKYCEIDNWVSLKINFWLY